MISFAANGRLHIVDLQKQHEKLNLPFYITNVFQQINNNKLLLGIVNQGMRSTVIYDLNDASVKTLYKGAASWAQLTTDNKLFISDFDGQYFSVTDNEKRLLSEINDLYPRSRFILKGEHLFIVDDLRNLWRYHSNSRQISKLMALGNGVRGIDDINISQNKLLLSKVTAAKKEIVLFHN